MTDVPLSNGDVEGLAHRLDQSITDFKTFMTQRFTDQDRRLDERFTTQTTTLNAAFAAAEKARQEALTTQQESTSRTDTRITDLESRMNNSSSRSHGRADVWGYVIGAAGLIGLVLAYWPR